ncbi:MAG: hypothetical protein KC416_04995, partial [Myxococcales bacterium]|nr:hypothetical protein [Myxococcales bacterium]
TTLATAAVVSAVILLALLGLAGCTTGDQGNEGVLPGVSAMLFVKRAYVNADGEHELGGNGNVFDYLRYVPGGGLYVLEPPTPDGTLRELTKDFEGVDIAGTDLSFDATQVVFAMRHAKDEAYHIHIANIDGSGTRQLTFGPADDVKPVWIAGDRIAFVTNQPYTAMGTRADEYNHARIVSQIATISVAGGDADRRVCAQNLSHTVDLFSMRDGRIGYSRWEHLGPVNDLKLFAMNPDCTQMTAVAGQFNKDFNSFVQAHELEHGVFVGIATAREGTFQAGALYRVDARSRTSQDPTRLDVQQATFENLTPLVPTEEESPPANVGRYRQPQSLPGSSDLLVSWANGDVNERLELTGTAPNFGIYLWNAKTRERTLVYDDPNMWDLYATPVAPRDVPPVRGDSLGGSFEPTTPAVLGSVDLTQTSLNETVRGGTLDGMKLDKALAQAERVRIIEGFSSEIGSVREFGLTMHEGAAILGEAPVYSDGSWEASVPPYLPYHLQPIDEYGLAIRNQMLWIQAMPGEERRCGGCHADRSKNILPRKGMTTLAQQAGPVDLNVPIADRTERPWMGATAGNIQDLFDNKCVGCHDGGANDPFAGRSYTVTTTLEDGETLETEIPYLNLTSEAADVYYENEVVAYPLSYVTLLYPSAMMGDSVAVGDVPPQWVEPGSARTSPLIEKVNAESEKTAGKWAFDSKAHPEDEGGMALTREERLMLIQMADLGGQYWSRKNVEGAAQWQEAKDYD